MIVVRFADTHLEQQIVKRSAQSVVIAVTFMCVIGTATYLNANVTSGRTNNG